MARRIRPCRWRSCPRGKSTATMCFCSPSRPALIITAYGLRWDADLALDGHKRPFTSRSRMRRASSGPSGSKVKRWKVGDEVVVHCNQDRGDDEDAMAAIQCSPSQTHRGYGRGTAFPVHPRSGPPAYAAAAAPEAGESARSRCTMGPPTGCSATARVPRPRHHVLVSGASGGLGSFARVALRDSRPNAIGVAPRSGKRGFVMNPARAHRPQGLQMLEQMPKVHPDTRNGSRKSCKFDLDPAIGATGEGNNVDFVSAPWRGHHSGVDLSS